MALENLGSSFRAIAGAVSKKTGDAVEITKMNLNISTLQNECDNLYRKIGAEIYTEVANGNTHSPEVVALCRQISNKLVEINALREKVEDVKSPVTQQQPFHVTEPLYTPVTPIKVEPTDEEAPIILSAPVAAVEEAPIILAESIVSRDEKR